MNNDDQNLSLSARSFDSMVKVLFVICRYSMSENFEDFHTVFVVSGLFGFLFKKIQHVYYSHKQCAP